MALKTLIQFPMFAPPNLTPNNHHRPSTELRFSRWNNANAEKFIRHDRAQKEIEDDLRRLKRFNSAHKIAQIHHTATATATTDTDRTTFRSTGTPSTPSSPSIPGKSSKYSKNPRISKHAHPAFRRPKLKPLNVPTETQKPETAVKVSDDGVSYIVPNAPFAFQHSYTETPKVKPLKLREPPVAPFGPATMPRPWTGRKPMGPSKKKLVEFDSFRLPPPDKKGVKPVQAPGPFLAGSGPKYVMSREEILGEPLTKEEIEELVISCKKTKRQLNMGRDGLTHNMLDNIHALWKRRRVCKIKCKGVCTVDMDNVRQQLEEKTGGKIIYGRGGVIYLFRGRNYNYKTRPLFPLMLWKPVTPVYPRLVQRVPEGLTLEDASEMRKRGRQLIPICKLGKNGVYCDLVKNVREAFEACELVRINCEGMNGSDYRRIGAKLKDLVPCVLISFEREHILMWRGRDWKSSLPALVGDSMVKNSEADGAVAPHLEGQEVATSSIPISEEKTSLTAVGTSTSTMCSDDVGVVGGEVVSIEAEDHVLKANDMLSLGSGSVSNVEDTYRSETPTTPTVSGGDDSEPLTESRGSKTISPTMSVENNFSFESISSAGNQPWPVVSPTCIELHNTSEMSQNLSDSKRLSSPWMEGVLVLWKEAIESGAAVVLDDSSPDSDIIYEKAVTLAKSAPLGPIFRHRRKKVVVQKYEKEKTGDLETEDLEVREIMVVSEKGGSEGKISERKSSTYRRTKDIKEDYLNVAPPQGRLRVDELAKLLA